MRLLAWLLATALAMAAPLGAAPAALQRLVAAARQGNPKAEYKLGVLLLKGGEGVAKNPAKGIEWLEKAAGHGDPRAQFRVARLEARGQGGREVDRVEAMVLLGKAAAGGLAQAEPAREKLAGELGAAELLDLGLAYRGRGDVLPDAAEARRWLEAAHAKGEAGAALPLGQLELAGGDPARGVALLQEALDAGRTGARVPLAAAYREGKGVAADPAKALELTRLAAEEDGVAEAQYQLALALLPPGKEEEAGKEWMAKAAAQYHPRAQAWMEANQAPEAEAEPEPEPEEEPPAAPGATLASIQLFYRPG